jgi:hypothetical protein
MRARAQLQKPQTRLYYLQQLPLAHAEKMLRQTQVLSIQDILDDGSNETGYWNRLRIWK